MRSLHPVQAVLASACALMCLLPRAVAQEPGALVPAPAEKVLSNPQPVLTWMAPMWSDVWTVTDVDAEARMVGVTKTFSPRNVLSVDGKRLVTVMVAKREPGSLRLTNGARLQRIEASLQASRLKVGDRVSLQKAPHPEIASAMGAPSLGASDFTVLSTAPLLLRAGSDAAERPGAEVARFPIAGAADAPAPIGEIIINRPLDEAAGVSRSFRVTLLITRPDALQFSRTTFLGLDQISEALRSGQRVEAEVGIGWADGVREIKSLTIREGGTPALNLDALAQRSLRKQQRIPLAPNPLLQRLQQ